MPFPPVIKTLIRLPRFPRRLLYRRGFSITNSGKIIGKTLQIANMRRQPQNEPQDYGSKMLHDLSTLVLNIIRSPPPSIDFSDESPRAHRRRRLGPSFQQITPAGFASLLLGISLTLMLCGSVTFFIGFVMMPWVLGLVVLLYFVGVVSSITMIGKAILCCNSAPPSPRKGAASWKLL